MELERTLLELTPGLMRYSLGLSGNREIAEEAAQEALVSLVRHWRQHGTPDSPRAFVFTVARRQIRRARWRDRSITRKNEPFSALLNTICLDLGCTWRIIDGNSPILEIVAE